MLSIGQSAPDFSLPSTTGTFQLSRDAKDQAIVIYFYPKDNTKVCTKEACEFRDQFEVLKKLNTKIIGISTDTVEKHMAFKEKYQLPFDLLSDTKGKVSKLYKAYIPFINLSKRITYLLNKDHQVVAHYSDLFNAEKHIEEILNSLES